MMIYTQEDIESARVRARYELAMEINAIIMAPYEGKSTMQRIRKVVEECEEDMAHEMDRVFIP
jgi:hypothetical protein